MVQNPAGSAANLLAIEAQFPSCEEYASCKLRGAPHLTLSTLPAGHPLRGSRDPRILIVTANPDAASTTTRPYAGPTGRNMLRMFWDPAFGLGLGTKPTTEVEEVAFLDDLRIYRTSAVKCGLPTGKPNMFEQQACHTKFLQPQLAAMPNLRVILPLGEVAISSVLGLQRPLTVGDYVGKPRGIRRSSGQPTIIAMPHPSSANSRFKAPSLATLAHLDRQRRSYDFTRDARGEDALADVAFPLALLELRDELTAVGFGARLTPLPSL